MRAREDQVDNTRILYVLKVLCIGSYAPYLGGSETWAPFLREFPKQDEVIIVDPLDVLGSPKPQSALAALIEERIRDVDVVITHAFSAADTLRVANVVPSNKRRIVLVSPILSDPTRKNFIGRTARSLFRSGIGKRILRHVAIGKIRKLKREDGAMARELDRLLASEPPSEILAQARLRLAASDANALADATAALPSADLTASAPTDSMMIVCGAAGATDKVMMPRLARMFPGVRIQVFEDCGVAAMLEQPQRLRAAIA